MTKQNGVDMWPSAAIWMQDELRSKVRYSQANSNCDSDKVSQILRTPSISLHALILLIMAGVISISSVISTVSCHASHLPCWLDVRWGLATLACVQ